MTKKNIFLITLVLLLAGFSLYLNRDYFRSAPIQIGDRSRPARGWLARRTQHDPANPVMFLFDRDLKLKSVKVVPVAAVETNKYAHPLWELTSASNSAPVREFVYGINIRGMKPAVKGVSADPLQPGTKYRLMVQTTEGDAEHDFVPVPRTP